MLRKLIGKYENWLSTINAAKTEYLNIGDNEGNNYLEQKKSKVVKLPIA